MSTQSVLQLEGCLNAVTNNSNNPLNLKLVCKHISLKVAHRYATFLCSWDVEIDDSLVGQLTSESDFIHRNASEIQMSSKAEWHQPALARVVVTRELEEGRGGGVEPRGSTDSSGGNKHVGGFSHTCVEKTTQVKNKNSKNNTKTNKFCVWSPPRLKDFL